MLLAAISANTVLLLTGLIFLAAAAAAFSALARPLNHASKGFIWLTGACGLILVSLSLIPSQAAGRKAGENRGSGSRPSAPRSPGALADSASAEAAQSESALEHAPSIDVRFATPPAASLLFDLETGDVIFSDNEQKVRPIASLTKLMTAILASEKLSPDQRFEIPEEVLEQEPTRVGLVPGKKMRVKDVLSAMLIASGNDAATALAFWSGGSAHHFVIEMNKRAKELGLACTHFESPNGLDPGDVSCARDLAALARLVLSDHRLAQIVRKHSELIEMPQAGHRSAPLPITSTNPLYRLGYKGAIGLKTGYTEAAGRCLIAAAQRRGHTLVAVLLDSPDPGPQAEKLLDRGFVAWDKEDR